MSLRNVSALPAAQSVKRIAFETAEVVPGFVNDTYFLIVRGEAPCLNMEVMLSPLVYIDCPDYWGIEVVGYLRGGICLTAMKPYALTILLAGITGSQGIEVIGGNRSERIDVPGGCQQGVSLAGEGGGATADSETIRVDSDTMTVDGGVTGSNRSTPT